MEPQETQVQPLVWENTIEEGTVTQFSILAWRINGQKSLAGTVHRVTKSRT